MQACSNIATKGGSTGALPRANFFDNCNNKKNNKCKNAKNNNAKKTDIIKQAFKQHKHKITRLIRAKRKLRPQEHGANKQMQKKKKNATLNRMHTAGAQ